MMDAVAVAERSATQQSASATRAWLAVAALGAGLLHLATGAGATVPALVALVIFGAVEVGWSIAVLGRDRPPFARVAVFAALVPIGCWALVATVGATYGASPLFAGLPMFPLLVAGALDVAIALTLVVSARRASRSPRASARRFLAALFLSAAAVTLVTVPALGFTGAGAQAVNVHLLHEGGHHH